MKGTRLSARSGNAAPQAEGRDSSEGHPCRRGVEHVAGAVNIPLPALRGRLAELPRDREILVICRSGQRAYYATRILLQCGFRARTLAGGMLSRTNLTSSPEQVEVRTDHE